MNPLAPLQSLRNRYFGLRHGESVANREGLIVSDPRNGVGGYGLTEAGRADVDASVRAAGDLDAAVRVLCSDFARTRETAAIACAALDAAEARDEVALRERHFGELELLANTHYASVWERDAVDPNHTDRGVESAAAVLARVAGVIARLEGEHEGQRFLLVAHGDALQLLQTAFLRLCPSTHRSRPHWAAAEVRELRLG